MNLKWPYLYLILSTSVLGEEVNQLETIFISEDAIASEAEVLEDSQEAETISKKDLEEAGVGSLDDILALSPSATTTGGPRSTSETPRIRGLETKKIGVYLDGAKQSFRTDHSSMLAFDPDDIKAVKISKSLGDFSGLGSLGGTISMTTKDASDYLARHETFGAQVKYGYQSAANENYYKAKVYTQDKKNDVLLSYGHRRAHDIELGNSEVLPNSSFIDTSFLVKGKIKHRARATTGLSLNSFQRLGTEPLNPTLNPPTSDEFSSLNGSSQTSRRTLTLSHARPELSASLTNLKFTTYVTEQEQIKIRESDKRKDTRNLKSYGIKGSSEIDLSKNAQVSLGAEFARDILTGEREGEADLPSYPSGSSDEIAIYSNSRIKLHENLVLSPGVRIQKYQMKTETSEKSKSAERLSKKLGVDIPFSFLNFNMTFSEGFNSPKVQDVYADGQHHPGDPNFGLAPNNFIPNEDLSHERSKMFEVSLSGERGLFNDEDLVTFRFGKYWNRVTDYVTTKKIERTIFDDPAYGTTQVINIPDVHLWGTEASLGYLYGNMEVSATYTQARGIQKNYDPLENEGYYLEQMPADQYTYRFKYQLERYLLSFTYHGVKTLDQDRVNPETDSRTLSTPGAFIHGISITKNFKRAKWRRLSLNSKVDNLTNQRYRKHGSNIQEVGLDYKLSLSYNF